MSLWFAYDARQAEWEQNLPKTEKQNRRAYKLSLIGIAIGVLLACIALIVILVMYSSLISTTQQKLEAQKSEADSWKLQLYFKLSIVLFRNLYNKKRQIFLESIICSLCLENLIKTNKFATKMDNDQ